MFATPSAAVQAARREEIIVEPDSERSKKLQARYNEVYRDLYGQLRTAHHRLHAERH
jgi:sugar (pentulose or hexulose) kinase